MEVTKTAFERFWQAYPKRSGSNPRAPALQKFERIVKSGVEAERIIQAAEEYRSQMLTTQKFGTEFVAMATTWLNQKRWEEHAVSTIASGESSPSNRVFVDVDTPQWAAWKQWRKERENRQWPQHDFRIAGHVRRGWFFPSEWPQ